MFRELEEMRKMRREMKKQKEEIREEIKIIRIEKGRTVGRRKERG